MEQLSNLRRDDKFKVGSYIYTVYHQDGNMVEVFGNGRFWAWPCQALVEKISKR